MPGLRPVNQLREPAVQDEVIVRDQVVVREEPVRDGTFGLAWLGMMLILGFLVAGLIYWSTTNDDSDVVRPGTTVASTPATQAPVVVPQPVPVPVPVQQQPADGGGTTQTTTATTQVQDTTEQ